MNNCTHGVFMTREYPLVENWTSIKAQCLECGEDCIYWEDRIDSHLEDRS